MTEPASLDDWMSAVVASAEELATVALGFEGSTLVGRRDSFPRDLNSALVALVSESASVQLGVASTDEGCRQLAGALLCLEPGEEELSDEDVADAVGEIANIVAGQVKRTIGGPGSSMKLGLPLFVHGKVETSSDTVETAAADITVGPVPVTLLVMKDSNDK